MEELREANYTGKLPKLMSQAPLFFIRLIKKQYPVSLRGKLSFEMFLQWNTIRVCYTILEQLVLSLAWRSNEEETNRNSTLTAF